MTDQTPATEAGRRIAADGLLPSIEDILAIEAEARADAEQTFWGPDGPDQYRAQGRADALRDAAERVRAGIPALTVELSTGQYMDVDAVLAILDPQP